MKIHTVRQGDTVFSIARKYGVSPMKIIENNALTDPDKLSVGEEILILGPTRTYTVRGGDTLDRIARRFGVRKALLHANNPYLAGTDNIYPGELIAIRYDQPRGGVGAANGYLFEKGKEESLRTALPYLTYLTVGCAESDGEDLRAVFDPESYLKAARETGKTVLMRIALDPADDAFFADVSRHKRWIEKAGAFAKEAGFDGITLAAYRMAREVPDLYTAFILEARRYLLGTDSILFTETDANLPPHGGDFADASVLMYEKCCLDGIPSFAAGEEKALTSYAEEYESSRMFIDLSPFGYDNGKPVTHEEIRKIAYRTKSEIRLDEETLTCSFEYPFFSDGKRQMHRVVWDSLHNTERKMALADELGYLGMAFDVSRTPIPTLMMIHTSFCAMNYPKSVKED